MKIEILGVYRIPDNADCHLIEIRLTEHSGGFSFGDFTQEVEGLDRSSWQAAYDEQWLTQEGTPLVPGSIVDGDEVGEQGRAAFYLHFLDFQLPLDTTAGPLHLPEASPCPSRLGFFESDPPT